MKLELRGPKVPNVLLKALERATDSAELMMSSVTFGEDSRILRFKLRRLVSPRTFSLRSLLRPPRSPETVECWLTVMGVEDLRIHRCNHAMEDRCLIMFGVQASDTSVSVVSAEEHDGKPCFELVATFRELSICLEDLP